MEVEFNNFVKLTTAGVTASVFVEAKGGTRPASPGAGECVWVDRGMRRGEVDHYGKITLWFPNYLIGTGMIDRVEVKHGKIKKVYFSSQNAKELFEAVYYGRTFYIRARRMNGSAFEVTKIGP